MTTRDTAFPPGTPCWAEYRCADIDTAAKFYSALFGWEIEEIGGYTNFVFDGRRVAGLVHDPTVAEPVVPEPAAPSESQAEGEVPTPAGVATPEQTGQIATRDGTWLVYICTTDIDESLEKAVTAGASILGPAATLGTVATTALIADPVGGKVGLWQPIEHTGYRRYNELSALMWSEHHSRDYLKSAAFFGAAFGWKAYSMADTDEFRYAQALLNGQIVAGLMDAKKYLPDGYDSYWAVYFSVANTDAAVEKTLQLGGSLIVPAEDTPFGRIADVIDPAGAPLKLHQAPQPTMGFRPI
jgi:predicted enzyme related to lactoylglutathione lyase